MRLLTPDHHYLAGEPITLFLYPPTAQRFELRIVADRGGEVLSQECDTTRVDLREGLSQGSYRITARWSSDPAAHEKPHWSSWSVHCPLVVHPEAESAEVETLRRWEHRHAMIADRDVHGVLTITDPWGFPPSCPSQGPRQGPRQGQVRWFRTPVYEGATTLLNEVESYYRDPLAYLLNAVDELRGRGAGFVTWHDVLDGRVGRRPLEVLLQFDVDGGPRSFERILAALLERDLRATVMVHREAHDWYTWSVEDLPLSNLRDAERAGWAIGYHQNAIGNVQRLDRAGDYGPQVMAEAVRAFRRDAAHLQSMFDVRTWTAHGGNVLNHRLVPPADVDIVCVDRTNAGAWQPIRTMFSDGGFASRPCPLAKKIDGLAEGLHFFRIHPNKYGNYEKPWDVPPLLEADAAARGVEVDDELRAWCGREIEKQQRWLAHRAQHRLGRRFSYASPHKPLSCGFRPFSDIEPLVTKFRGRRKPFFLREYPDPSGDPRVFWWRMLDALAPEQGPILNVGALPPESRDETTSFLAPGVEVIEMDIDESRRPHILGDITYPPEDVRGRFIAVLLFGLPYVHSPGRAIDACRGVVKGGGIGLFGFPDDTHPMRGALFNPRSRPLWRRECEPLDDIGLRGNLWSFDEASLTDLFRAWDEVIIENFSHYWFVLAVRGKGTEGQRDRLAATSSDPPRRERERGRRKL